MTLFYEVTQITNADPCLQEQTKGRHNSEVRYRSPVLLDFAKIVADELKR